MRWLSAGLHGEHRIAEYGKGALARAVAEWRIGFIVALKAVCSEEGRRLDAVGMELVHSNRERVTAHQVPRVAMKFSLNI